MSKQWDEGAFLIYDYERARMSIDIDVPVVPVTETGRCLVQADADGVSNAGCMQDFIANTNVNYWRYERHDTQPTDTRGVDACIVFTGPAKYHQDADVRSEFRKCAHEYSETGCTIPHMVWSASSANRVPVANLHVVDLVSSTSNPDAYAFFERQSRAVRHANSLFEQAQTQALAALQGVEDYANENLNVVLFSGEGDSLHQVPFRLIMFDRSDFESDSNPVES